MSSDAKFHKIEALFFYSLLVLYVLPIWYWTPFPTQDGGSHSYNAALLTNIITGNCLLQTDFFCLNTQTITNWLGQLIIAGLLLVLPDFYPEKIVLSVFACCFPLSLRYALTAIRPQSRFLSLAAFVLLYCEQFFMGFYNFLLGLPLMVLLIGFWLKHHLGPGMRRWLLMGVMAMAVGALHPFPLAVAAVTIGLLAFTFMMTSFAADQKRSWPNTWALIKTYFALPILCFMPALILFGGALLKSNSRIVFVYLPWQRRVLDLLSGSVLIGLTRWEGLISIVFTVLLLFLMYEGFRYRRFKANTFFFWGMLTNCLAFLTVYFTAPDALIDARNHIFLGGYLNSRFALILLILLILLLGTRWYHRRVRKGLVLILAVLGCFSLGVKTHQFPQFSENSALFVRSAARIEPNTLVLYLPRSPSHEFIKADPYLHLLDHWLAAKCVVGLNNYEAGRAVCFPVRFRETMRFDTIANFDEYDPMHVNLDAYEKHTGRLIDYIVLWQKKQLDRIDNRAGLLGNRLVSHYNVIFEDETATGTIVLYQRKPLDKLRRIY
jgi:hypothetical protein